MRQKLASNTPLELYDLIDKYLFFMTYIRSSSPQTLRSYRTDLRQAFSVFHEENTGSGEISEVGDPNKYSIEPDYRNVINSNLAPKRHLLHPLPTSSREELENYLLRTCRKSMQNWSGLSPASRNRKVATLKSFFGWLHAEHLIDRDLAAQLHSPKVPQRLPQFLSVDDAILLTRFLMRKVDQASNKELRSAMIELVLFCLLYGGGLRVSEACQLSWKQIDLQTGVIRITGKGQQERLGALPELAIQTIQKWMSLQTEPHSYVFGPTPLSTRKAYEIIRSLGRNAGLIQPIHPHVLRHSFATHLLSSGANLRTLQELLGHRSLQATQKYTHLGLDDLARTLESFHPLEKK